MTSYRRAIPDFLCDMRPAGGEVESVGHAASTNSSILKLSGRSACAPWSDESRWGHQVDVRTLRPRLQ
jgi:hypothetical protein